MNPSRASQQFPSYLAFPQTVNREPEASTDRGLWKALSTPSHSDNVTVAPHQSIFLQVTFYSTTSISLQSEYQYDLRHDQKSVRDISTTPQPPKPESPVDSIAPLSSSSATEFVDLGTQTPFTGIKNLFDHLHASPDDAAQLNVMYQRCGIVKETAQSNTRSDQKIHH